MGTRSQSRLFIPAVIVTAVLAVSVIIPRSTPVAAQSSGVQGPIIGPPVAPISFDRDLRTIAQHSVTLKSWLFSPIRRGPAARSAPGPSSIQDPIRQARLSGLAMPPLVTSFAALDFAHWGSGWPPDPNGAVGPNHYIETVNTSIGIFDKTGLLLAAATYDDFFAGTGTPCDVSNRGDPIVLYDHLTDRWLISDMAWYPGAGPFYECLAVSKSGDPVAGGWWLYALQTGQTSFGDYPKLGIWSDGYYLSANMFTLSYLQTSVRVWALNRQAMIQGQPLVPVSFDLTCMQAACYNTLLPANLLGASPPAGTPEFYSSIDMPDKFHLWKFHVDWSVPAASTFTGPTDLTVAPFVMPCDSANVFACVPELGGEYVDSVGDRLMHPLQYRRINSVESLWATHTVASSSAIGVPTGVRWYEIRNPSVSPMVYQQGTFQPDNNYRWMPSLATDNMGNMAIGYSVSSSSMYPAIRYAGRLVTDTLGTLGQGESTLISGTGSQSGAFNRWGDYSSMMIDPTDDCTFWYTNEYYTSIGQNWQTQVGSFRFPNCAASPVPSPSPSATATSVPSPIIPSATATPKAPRCEDAYEPDNSISLAHVITGPELHNFSSPQDEDWVKFNAVAGWVYWIKADPDRNFPTAPRLELYADGALVAQNDHANGNTAELWWWNNGADRGAAIRVTEVNHRGDCGNSQYTLSVRGYKDKP